MQQLRQAEVLGQRYGGEASEAQQQQLHSPPSSTAASLPLSPSSLWSSSPASSTSSTPRARPGLTSVGDVDSPLIHHHYTKRRKLHEIPSRQRWRCANSECLREYKRTSTTSIAEHKRTCRWRALIVHEVVDINTSCRAVPAIVTLEHHHEDLNRFCQLQQQAQQPIRSSVLSELLLQSFASVPVVNDAFATGERRNPGTSPFFHAVHMVTQYQRLVELWAALQPPRITFQPTFSTADPYYLNAASFHQMQPTRTQHSSSCPPPTAPPRGDHLSFVSPRVSDPSPPASFVPFFVPVADDAGTPSLPRPTCGIPSALLRLIHCEHHPLLAR